MENNSPSPDETAGTEAPGLSAALPATTDPADLDAHGFDPAAYKWIPVLRRPRKDGWTQARQIQFIAALADCGVVEEAARRVSMTPKSCYRLRRAPGAGNFAAAWDAAIQQASKRLLDLAFDRAINGSNEPVFDKDGRRIGRRMKTNDRLLMFLLRAYMPDRFAAAAPAAAREPRTLDHEPPLALAPVSEALARLGPVAPEEPQLLLPREELDIAYEMADMLQGAVPHWHRGRPEIVEPDEAPLGAEFERMLENVKRSLNDLPPLPDDAGVDRKTDNHDGYGGGGGDDDDQDGGD